ncbi:MAG: FadR family transcriptional regulator [Lentisphaerae bacterium]|nr:FadR family transcriptional regulator [Lentisphaerota bacterium]MCP4101040.1 FadR family transcriptional regulator [Lentisphaerota bacterium]
MFKTVRKQSAMEAVIDAIQKYILQNRLQKGDRLPPETLGGSRNILREALRHFRMLGVIISKPKTGAEINCLFPENPFYGYQPFIAAWDKDLNDLVKARRVLELGAVDNVLSHSCSDDIDKLNAQIWQLPLVRLSALKMILSFINY